MNKLLLLVCLFSFIWVSLSHKRPITLQEQNEFENALGAYVKNSPPIKFNKKPAGRANPIMRSSSEKGKYLHNLFEFTSQYAQNVASIKAMKAAIATKTPPPTTTSTKTTTTTKPTTTTTKPTTTNYKTTNNNNYYY